MDVSPLAGASQSAGTGEYEYLGRARTLKAIAALIGVASVGSLLVDLSSLGACVTGAAIQHEGFAWLLSGTLYSAAMCVGAALLWRLHPIGLFAIAAWMCSLCIAVYYLLAPSGTKDAKGFELDPRGFEDEMLAALALFLAPLAAYLAWLLISSRTRAVVFSEDHQWLQRESKLAGTTVAALALIGLVVAAQVVQKVSALFA